MYELIGAVTFVQTNRRLNLTSKGRDLIDVFIDSLIISQTDRHSYGVCGDPLITDVVLYDQLSWRLTEQANVYRSMA